MKTAHETSKQLTKLDAHEMITHLSDLKNIHPDSIYVDYLAKIALSKHNDTRDRPVPPPHQVLSKMFFDQKTLSGETIQESPLPGSPDPESRLQWWRTDPGMNEHHNSWHHYYPLNKTAKPRQGELFAFMHEQMLARYNFERLAVGLAPVRPYGPGIGWDDPLPEGFDGDLANCSARPPNMSIPDSVTFQSQTHILTSDMENYHDLLKRAIDENNLQAPNGTMVDMTMDILGCTVEAGNCSVNYQLHGSIHNFGHIVLALVNDPDESKDINYGPMIHTQTAARDPVFFRWHKFINSIFESYRLKLSPHTKDTLTMDGIELLEVNVTTDNMPKGKRKVPSYRNQLQTKMKIASYYVGIENKRKVVHKEVMDYYRFTYHFKLRCLKNATAVFRVFLAPVKQLDNINLRRNDFVVLDTFVKKVEENSEYTFTRKSLDSSVLMEPFPTVEEIKAGRANKPCHHRYCGCGWPKNLLIPRGTREGMRTDLFVMVTNWEDDAVNPDVLLSGNVVLCGKEGVPYPDKKPMGFPFDRNIHISDNPKHNTLDRLVQELPNTAKADVLIKFMQLED